MIVFVRVFHCGFNLTTVQNRIQKWVLISFGHRILDEKCPRVSKIENGAKFCILLLGGQCPVKK